MIDDGMVGNITLAYIYVPVRLCQYTWRYENIGNFTIGLHTLELRKKAVSVLNTMQIF